MNDAQGFQGREPELRREYDFVVGADHAWQAVNADGDEKMPEHDQGALRRQHFQAQQFARAGVEDAEHGEGRPERRADEGQVQRPGMTRGYETRPMSFAPSAPFADLGLVLAHELPHPGLADGDPAAMPPVEGVGDGAAARAVETAPPSSLP